MIFPSRLIRRGWIAAVLLLAGAAGGDAAAQSTQPSGVGPTSAPATSSAPAGPAPGELPTDQEAELALRLIQEGRFPDALNYARSAYTRATSPRLELLAFGTALDANGHSFEAVDYLKRYIAFREGDRDWRGHARLGSLYLRMGNFVAAIKHLRKAAMNPTLGSLPTERVYVMADLAQAQIGNHESRQALETLRSVQGRLVELQDPRLGVLFTQVLYEASGGVTGEVLRSIEWSTRLAVVKMGAASPDDASALVNLARCYDLRRQMLTRDIEAIEAARAAGNIDRAKMTNLVNFKIMLASQSLEVSDIESRARLIEALGFARAALKDDPPNAAAREMVGSLTVQLADAHLRTAAVLLQSKEAAPARATVEATRTFVQKAAERPDATVGVRMMLAHVRRQMGDTPAAIAALEAIVRDVPDHVGAKQMLAAIVSATQPASAPAGTPASAPATQEAVAP
ncbi:MAG: tetratricopeptide repeat protein [Phycisphaerae bacterium]|nr:tetratricopeptide repeat protein [Phycisphaerae bacterium]